MDVVVIFGPGEVNEVNLLIPLRPRPKCKRHNPAHHNQLKRTFNRHGRSGHPTLRHNIAKIWPCTRGREEEND